MAAYKDQAGQHSSMDGGGPYDLTPAKQIVMVDGH